MGTGTISKLFSSTDWRDRFEQERTRRRRLEVAAAYRDAREMALLDLAEEHDLHEEAAHALADSATDGHEEAQRIRARHDRERP